MNKVPCITLILLFILSCSTIKKFTPYDGYKGKPKIVETIYSTLSKNNDTIIKTVTLKEIAIYDSLGRNIKGLIYSKGKSVPSNTIDFLYDEGNNVIEEIFKDKENKISSIAKYKYNKFGQEVLRESIFNNKINSTITTYNWTTNASFIKMIDSSEKIVWQGKIVYKKRGQYKKIYSKNFDEPYIIASSFEYNKLGKCIVSNWYDHRGNLNYFDKKTYDINGVKIKTESFTLKNGVPILNTVLSSKSEYLLDSLGNQILDKPIDTISKNVFIIEYRFTY